MTTTPPDKSARLRPHYDRVMRRLVEAHAVRDDEPLVLAVRFQRDDLQDLHLLEVLANFPGGDSDALLETEFQPSADLVILGKLHLVLASPAQLHAAIARGDAVIGQVTHDSEVLFPRGPATGEANDLLRALGLRS
jgi:hypothetical protein